MIKMLNVTEIRWNFYECVEAGDLENASAYFETLFHHYRNRGKRIKSLLKNSEPKGSKTNKDLTGLSVDKPQIEANASTSLNLDIRQN